MANTQAFSIAESAEAFNILSSKLYSNPILAVIRELSSNAYDAQVAADTNDEHSVEVHLPTLDKCYFSVRDWGTGLSEDEIFMIYTKFFASTKKEDDKQIGAFGLGSKSPFAVATSYLVKSYQDGVLKTYKMDSSNYLPTVTKISEESTQEHDGLEVYVNLEATKYNDPWTWKSQAIEFFKGTAFLPQINLPTETIESLILDREYFTTETVKWNVRGIYSPKMSVNVAGVSFLLKNSNREIWGEELGKVLTSLGISNINILANKFDVKLTPSREELHFDDDTIKFIKKTAAQAMLNAVEAFDDSDLSKVLDILDCCIDSFDRIGIYQEMKDLLEEKAGKYLIAWNALNTKNHVIKFVRTSASTHFPFYLKFLDKKSFLADRDDKSVKGIYKVDLANATKAQEKALVKLFEGSTANNMINSLASFFDDDVLKSDTERNLGYEAIFIFDDLASNLEKALNTKFEKVNIGKYENYFKRWNNKTTKELKAKATSTTSNKKDSFFNSQTLYFWNGCNVAPWWLEEKGKDNKNIKNASIIKIIGNTYSSKETDAAKLRALALLCGPTTIIAYRRGADKWYENQKKAGFPTLEDVMKNPKDYAKENISVYRNYFKILQSLKNSSFEYLPRKNDLKSLLDPKIIKNVKLLNMFYSDELKEITELRKTNGFRYLERYFSNEFTNLLTIEEEAEFEKENKAFEILKIVDSYISYDNLQILANVINECGKAFIAA